MEIYYSFLPSSSSSLVVTCKNDQKRNKTVDFSFLLSSDLVFSSSSFSFRFPSFFVSGAHQCDQRAAGLWVSVRSAGGVAVSSLQWKAGRQELSLLPIGWMGWRDWGRSVWVRGRSVEVGSSGGWFRRRRLWRSLVVTVAGGCLAAARGGDRRGSRHCWWERSRCCWRLKGVRVRDGRSVAGGWEWRDGELVSWRKEDQWLPLICWLGEGARRLVRRLLFLSIF